jgi:hypothetical protein
MPGWPKAIASHGEVKVKVRREPQEQSQEGERELEKEEKKEEVDSSEAEESCDAQDSELAKREEKGDAGEDAATGVEQAEMRWASISPLSALEVVYLADDAVEFDLSKLISESWV